MCVTCRTRLILLELGTANNISWRVQIMKLLIMQFCYYKNTETISMDKPEAEAGKCRLYKSNSGAWRA
jgi:hypothetical protein